ncbi:MAG: hypothetical protein IJA78_03700 [Clostridia bacterium]|nr:hypothetical protein [Clostridia bacterium]
MLPIPSERRFGHALAVFGAGAICAWLLPRLFMGALGVALLLTTGYFLTREKGGLT